MNTINCSLFDTISTLDNVPRIAALRGIANSSMAKCIGAIRQDIRNRNATIRNEEIPQNDLDQRNGHDEDERVGDEIKVLMGFPADLPPLRLASLLHAVHEWASSELYTLSSSKWDSPLSVEQMLEYMTNNARRASEELINELAKILKVKPQHIAKIDEIQIQQERDRLIEARDEIIKTFNGFGTNGYESALEDLPKLFQHQMGVKAVETLGKAKDAVISRILRSRKMSDLANVPLIEEGVTKISAWVTQFENTHIAELNEAMEAGRTVRTLEDIEA